MRRELVLLAIGTATWTACMPPTTYGLRTDGALGDPGEARIGASGLVVVNPRVDSTTPGGEIEGTHVLGSGTAVSAAGGSVAGLAHAQADLRVGSFDPDDRLAGHGIAGVGAYISQGGMLAGPYGGGVLGVGVTRSDRIYLGGKVNPVGSNAAGTLIWWLQPTVGLSHRWTGVEASSVTVGAEVTGLVPVHEWTATEPLYAAQLWLSFAPPREDYYETAWDDDDEPPED